MKRINTIYDADPKTPEANEYKELVNDVREYEVENMLIPDYLDYEKARRSELWS
ncbi:hypothetical protein [Adhaeribacter aquaticus]|uniref:hypothetical protein n=1 Tax=Adhaeribacter aquaticus TaxID=299567 RepID=UPI001B7F7FCE|nr:hypothetical protein [Adhaeribacter aquaticus]